MIKFAKDDYRDSLECFSYNGDIEDYNKEKEKANMRVSKFEKLIDNVDELEDFIRIAKSLE